MLLKQSTTRNLMVLMIDSSDHLSGKAGLTLTITASKDGGAFASITPTVTERGNGWYALALTASHTDTLGDLALHITGSGADATDMAGQVVADLPGIAQTGDAYARLGAPAGASVSADIASVKTDTGTTILGRLPAALVSGRMDASVGAYQSGLTPLQPTVAGRTLDVSATGEAGIDWANIGAPTTTVNLSGTTISTTQAVASVAGAVGSVTSGVTVTTNNDKTGYSLSSAPPTAAQVATAVWQDTTAGDFTVASSIGRSLYTSGNAPGAASGLALVGSNMGTVSSVTGNVGGNITGSVGSVASAVSVTGDLSATMKSSVTTACTASTPTAAAVTGAVTVGTNNDKTGYALTAAYDAAKTAASQTSVNAIDDYVDTEVAAIKAVTDKLDTAVELDGAVYRFTANALENAPAGVGGGSGDWTTSEKEQIRSALGVDGTKVAAVSGQLQTLQSTADAIKAKTDISASVSEVGSIVAAYNT